MNLFMFHVKTRIENDSIQCFASRKEDMKD